MLGAVARAVATILVYPYIRAKVLAQSQNKASKKSGESNGKSEKRDSSGLGSVIAETIKNEGVLGLYRGLGPELFRVSVVMPMLQPCGHKPCVGY